MAINMMIVVKNKFQSLRGHAMFYLDGTSMPLPFVFLVPLVHFL